MISEHFFTDRGHLIAALADDCEARLRTAIEQRQAATLLVSGGSSPLLLYQRLSAIALAWSKVEVALVDERWVATNHPGSNEACIKKNLLQHKATAAHFTAMKTPAETATLGWKNCEQVYQQLPRPFDLTILGMGSDGHTASLFPAAKGLEQALAVSNKNLCAAITANLSTVTGDLTERMSLTLSALMQSRQLHLLITGEEKLAVYQRALETPDQTLMPVSAVLHQDEIPVLVYWAP